jgi:hypothetical protein
MTLFEKYSEQQRAQISECLEALANKTKRFISVTWTGEAFALTDPAEADQLTVGACYSLRTKDVYFSAVIQDLEMHARRYAADVAENPDISKKQLQAIAALCARLAEALSNVSAYWLGLGKSKWRRVDDEHKTTYFLKNVAKAGEPELVRLVETLHSIERTVSNSVFFVSESASKYERNEYLKRVFHTWLAQGGTLGGPKSPMISFFLAACKPVLGNNHPTDEALVKLAYAFQASGWRSTRRMKFLKIKL